MALPTVARSRPLSGLERVWLAADRIQAPFVNQLVIEGRPGDALRAEAVRQAAAEAAEANPGAALRLAGRLGWARWEAGAAPGFRVVDGARWDGNSPDGAPFLDEPLDPIRGPAAEVLLVQGDLPRLVIRTHHALTDGRGATLFAADLFRRLRGEAPEGSAAGPLTDAMLARAALTTLPPPTRVRGLPELVEPGPSPPADRPAPTGISRVFAPGSTWRRLRIRGRFPQLLPRLIRALHQRQHPDAPLRIGVSADLRPFSPEAARSMANLSGVLHLDLAGLSRGPEAVDGLAGWIEAHRRDALQTPIHHDRLRWLPLSLIARAGRDAAIKALRAGRYPISATLSNLGRQDLRQWQAAGFRCQAAYWIPPGSPGMPLFLAASGDDGGVDLIATVPLGLADGGRLEALLADLRADLLVDSLRTIGRGRG